MSYFSETALVWGHVSAVCALPRLDPVGIVGYSQPKFTTAPSFSCWSLCNRFVHLLSRSGSKPPPIKSEAHSVHAITLGEGLKTFEDLFLSTRSST